MKTKKVKLNIVLVVKASRYFAEQLKDNVERTVGANCFNTNTRTVLSAKVVSIRG